MGDKQAISTVLQLLVDNALKFSESKVIVSAQSMGSHVRLAVTDYGIGIPEEQREAIFQTFYQVDNSSTRRYGGIGVGLAIVQLILERHNVQISVQSKVGVGSTFSFMLPAASI
jgi:signal transduction histidine kinase